MLVLSANSSILFFIYFNDSKVYGIIALVIVIHFLNIHAGFYAGLAEHRICTIC